MPEIHSAEYEARMVKLPAELQIGKREDAQSVQVLVAADDMALQVTVVCVSALRAEIVGTSDLE